MNKNSINRHAIGSRRKPSRPQSCTKDYTQLRNAESRRNSCQKGIARKLFIFYQIYLPCTFTKTVTGLIEWEWFPLERDKFNTVR